MRTEIAISRIWMKTRRFRDSFRFERTFATSRFTALAGDSIWAITSLLPGPALETCADCPSNTRGGVHLRRERRRGGGREGRGRENKRGIVYRGDYKSRMAWKSVRSPFSQISFSFRFSAPADLRDHSRYFSIFNERSPFFFFLSHTVASLPTLQSRGRAGGQ